MSANTTTFAPKQREDPMSSTQSIQHTAMVNTHMKLRAHLLAALDEAISEVGHEHVARALIVKDTSWALLAERDQLAAEIEALRAEVERLKKALKDIRSLSSIDSAMIPSPLALTVLLGNMHHIADAALTKENSDA